MVALIADILREEIMLACSRYRYRIKRVTKAEDGFIDFLKFHVVQKNPADNVLFKRVREKLFMCGFIVWTLYIYHGLKRSYLT